MSELTIREVIERATPGPWVLDYDKGSTRDILSLKHGGICSVRRAGRHDNTTFSANTQLIARCSPDVMALVIDALEKARTLLLDAAEPEENFGQSEWDGSARACAIEIKKALNALNGITNENA